MKNTLQDLNNHLFEQLERLNDEDLTDEQLDRELKRADGMTKIATQIIENGELAFKTMVHMDEYGYNNGHQQIPVMLEAHTQGGLNDLQIPARGPRSGQRVGPKTKRPRAGRAGE